MKYIKTIVVADDESMQCEILSQIISQMIPEAQIFSCSNGAEAYEIIRERSVDVLVTDIRMPEMDGMMLIEKVSKEFPGVKTLLISAYQEFEYARNAIKFGVFDYLVKPFHMDTIEKLLERIDEKIREEQEMFQQKQLYQQDYQKQQLETVIRGTGSIEDLGAELYEAIARPGTVLLFRWKLERGQRRAGYMTERQQEEFLQMVEKSFMGGYFIPQEKGIVNQECRMVLLAPGWSVEECQREAERILEESIQKNVVFWCGISQCSENIVGNIRNSMSEAEDMIGFFFFTRHTGGVFSWKDYSSSLDLIMRSLTNVEMELREWIHKGEDEKAVKRLEKLEQKYAMPPYIAQFRIRHAVSSMMMRLIRDLEGMLTHAEYDSLINEVYDLYGKCDSLEDLFGVSCELVRKECAYFQQETGSQDAVKDIILYIRKHFQEELSLQDLAERAHFSTNYLSAQIKKRTGMSYIEYLNVLRLEEAKNLLLNSNMKVMDIAKKCGFNDSSYFNRAFRRIYQSSPEQYRKVHKNVEENT